MCVCVYTNLMAYMKIIFGHFYRKEDFDLPLPSSRIRHDLKPPGLTRNRTPPHGGRCTGDISRLSRKLSVCDRDKGG